MFIIKMCIRDRLATAKEELAGLQEADAQYRKEIEEEAERKENERIKRLEDYWNRCV